VRIDARKGFTGYTRAKWRVINAASGEEISDVVFADDETHEIGIQRLNLPGTKQADAIAVEVLKVHRVTIYSGPARLITVLW
jgi:hypothetical protein